MGLMVDPMPVLRRHSYSQRGDVYVICSPLNEEAWTPMHSANFTAFQLAGWVCHLHALQATLHVSLAPVCQEPRRARHCCVLGSVGAFV